MFKNKKNLLRVLFAIMLVIFVFSAYKVISIISEYKKARDEYSEIYSEAVTPAEGQDEEGDGFLNVRHETLAARNSDYAGWIDIPDSKISYPIVMSSDNEEYIHTSFDGSYTSGGSIFLDCRGVSDFSAQNVIIYGHNMKDGSMFRDVKLYKEESRFKDYPEIYIYTPENILVYHVFSFFETTSDSSVYDIVFSDGDAFLRHIDMLKRNSWFSSEVKIGADDKIITLSTCSRTNSEYRWVLTAVLEETLPIKTDDEDGGTK